MEFMDLTEQDREVVLRGDLAKEVLENPVFGLLCDMTLDALKEQILALPALDGGGAFGVYKAQMDAITNLIASLEALVVQKDQLLSGDQDEDGGLI